MKNITMADRFHNGKYFSQGSTRVTVEGNVVKLLLHGNCIAQRTPLAFTITNCGWFTRSTKERLNALHGVNIVQEKEVWYLNGKEWDGEDIIIGGMS